MFRYLIVTRVELTTLITSPLLPLGMENGGGLRDTSEVSEPGAGPLSPEQPLWLVSAGASPWITRLKRFLIRTGLPRHTPWTVIVLIVAEDEVLVLATWAIASGRLQGRPEATSQNGVGAAVPVAISIRQAPSPWHSAGRVALCSTAGSAAVANAGNRTTATRRSPAIGRRGAPVRFQ